MRAGIGEGTRETPLLLSIIRTYTHTYIYTCTHTNTYTRTYTHMRADAREDTRRTRDAIGVRTDQGFRLSQTGLIKL